MHKSTSTSTLDQPLAVQKLMRTSLYAFIFLLSIVIFALSIGNISQFKDDILTVYFDPTFALLFSGTIGTFFIFPAHLYFHRRTHDEGSLPSELSSVRAELIALFPMWAITLGGSAALAARVGTDECVLTICSRAKTLESLAWISFILQTILFFSIGNVTHREGKRGMVNVWKVAFEFGREMEMKAKAIRARDLESLSDSATMIGEKRKEKTQV